MSALALASALTATGQAQTLSKKVKADIADILSVKDTFTPAEQKMDSRLVFAERKALGQNIGTAAKKLVKAKATDVVEVEIATKAKVSPKLAQSVVAYGGALYSVTTTKVKNNGRIHAAMPLTSLSNLAADDSVVSIRPVPHMMTNVGGLTSQGYVVETANSVINTMGFDGTGVKVGVLSDSASQAQINALKASGDLNASAYSLVPYDDGSGGDLATDEGAAIMEIVQDMAPGATVIFATAYSTPAEFAANIEALQAAGCKVIVDDVSYSGEGPFQDDVIARAVDAVAAKGVFYTSSAGNSGNVAHGTSGTWQGNFVNGGTYTPPPGSGTTKTYNIAQIGATNVYDQLALLGEPYIDMEWSDPLGASTNDYDFFAIDSTGSTLKGFSVTVQNGSQDPVEELDFTDIGGNYGNPEAGDLLVITQTTGAAARFLRIDTNRGQLVTFTDGSTVGHQASANSFDIAATFWNSSLQGVKPLSASDSHPCETFSSDGPRQMFYMPNGTPFTPGNFLAGGGSVLQKPDATAVDGVSCETPGFSPFFGTSAAGPHCAGIAALMLSANPNLTVTDVFDILHSTAIDSEAPGYDVTAGYGVIDAMPAVTTALTTP